MPLRRDSSGVAREAGDERTLWALASLRPVLIASFILLFPKRLCQQNTNKTIDKTYSLSLSVWTHMFGVYIMVLHFGWFVRRVRVPMTVISSSMHA